MTNEAAIQVIIDLRKRCEMSINETLALKKAIQALENQDQYEKFADKLWKIAYNRGVKEAFEENDAKEKRGKWICYPHERGENWEYPRYECSECYEWSDYDSDYCPNCGAKMKK